jgi:hypothetical protein
VQAPHSEHAHAVRASAARAGSTPRATSHATVIFPQGVSVSRGSALETGQVERQSFGQ